MPCLNTEHYLHAGAVQYSIFDFFVKEPTVENIQKALGTFLSGNIRFDQEECGAFAEKFTRNKLVNQALPYYWK